MHGGLCYNKFINLQGDSRHAGSDIWAGIHKIQAAFLYYKQIFSRFEDREATLTTVESFCMEVIMALGEPTIAQFSHMMNLSTPNAAYKINSLVKKGYVERIQSTTDKREYRLRPTQKYIDYYNISYSYLHLVMERAKQRFSPDDLAKLEEMLQIVSDELMPEIQLPK